MFRPITFYRITDLVAGIESSRLVLIDNYNNGDRHSKTDGIENQPNRFAPYTVTKDPPWPLLAIHIHDDVMMDHPPPSISREMTRWLAKVNQKSFQPFFSFSLLIFYRVLLCLKSFFFR